MMLEVIWLVAFNTTIKLIRHSYMPEATLSDVCDVVLLCFLNGACVARLLSIRKPLWVYEHTRSLDKLHGKKLAKVTHLHTLLVLNVLKMLEATSFEKIYTVKKWTRMQNKQCNGVKVSLKVLKFYNNELQTCRLRRLRVTSSLSWWNFCSNLMSICKKISTVPQFSKYDRRPPTFKIWQTTVSSLSLRSWKDFQILKKGSVVLIERCSKAISSTVASVKFLIFQDLAHRDVQVAFKSV